MKTHHKIARAASVAALVAAAMGLTTANAAGSAPRYETSSRTAQMMARLTPDAPDVVTNGPIRDTAANRLRYGEPMSHAGRASKPLGN